jgi:hypothetical protein
VSLVVVRQLQLVTRMRSALLYAILITSIVLHSRPVRCEKPSHRDAGVVLLGIGGLAAISGHFVLGLGIYKKLDYGLSALDYGTPKNPTSEDREGNLLTLTGIGLIVASLPLFIGGAVLYQRADQHRQVALGARGLTVRF